jgi:hypothetical protein
VNADHLTTLPPGPKDVLANPHLRGDGEQVPLAGHTFELVTAALLELKP